MKEIGRIIIWRVEGDLFILNEGDWKDNNKEGRGKYVYANGAAYEGDFKNGNMEGQGKYIHGNGDVYEGHWKNNKKEEN
jgi:hypothetical protein